MCRDIGGECLGGRRGGVTFNVMSDRAIGNSSAPGRGRKEQVSLQVKRKSQEA